jgi:hypothetical protein
MAEDTGEVVFKMPAPHDTLKIMVKILQWSSCRHVTRCSQRQECFSASWFYPSDLRSDTMVLTVLSFTPVLWPWHYYNVDQLWNKYISKALTR